MPRYRYLLPLLFILTFVYQGWSTHNRAGQITYKRIEPFTATVGGIKVPVFTYSITITKYTADGSGIADRCVDTIFFGDGQSGLALRINGNTGSCCQSVNGNTVGCGVLIINEANYKVKENIYTIIHTYPGAGTYIIRSFDPNRNGNVHNIPNSINLPFYIESMLVITNNMGANSSPVFSFKPIDKACLNNCFEHNPGAFDPDNDSLSFEISTSRGLSGQTVLGYFYPETQPGGTYGINARTGELRWCTPQFTEEYNIAFIVREWRRPAGGGAMELIGYVLRDMQVIVEPCPNLHPPEILPIPDVCVVAGTQVNQQISVRDLPVNDQVTITGGGGAFQGIPPLATISPTLVTITSTNSAYALDFKWLTSCDHIRKQLYTVTLKAQDAGKGSNTGVPIKQVAYESFNIQVIPPAVKNVTAVPLGTTMKITWSPTTCNPSSNKLQGYKIYRKDDCEPYNPGPCQVGISPSTGFVEIGTTVPTQTVFLDDNKGDGLVVGQNYSYIVVALYSDESVSFGSSVVCSELKRDVPVLINTDVLSTSNTGSVQVKWLKPLTTPGNLDLNVFKGPYKFNLLHRSRPADPFSTVFTTTQTDFNLLQEDFVHSGIRTDSLPHEYILEFYSDTTKIGSSQRATTIFLITTPADRRIEMRWESRTPWDNYKYTVFRLKPGATNFVSIATTTATSYVDRDSVENGQTYCYFIRSEGAYSDSTIVSPLINNSQESCCTAKDLTPPATPTLFIDANCPTGYIQVTWTNIADQSDDVGKYILYYKPSVSGEYSEVVTVKQNEPLVYNSDAQTSISGCYAIRAVDINGNVGQLSEDFCIDNCPEFELPNVFSPNEDNINDHFMAIKVRQIKEIYLTITDRWGNLVYTTNDPYFKWNGESQVTKLPVSEGTFFYVCEVFEPRLQGITKRTIKGYVHCVR